MKAPCVGVAPVTEIAEPVSTVSVTVQVLCSVIHFSSEQITVFSTHQSFEAWHTQLQADGSVLMENGLLRAVLDKMGRLVSLLLVQTNRSDKTKWNLG